MRGGSIMTARRLQASTLVPVLVLALSAPVAAGGAFGAPSAKSAAKSQRSHNEGCFGSSSARGGKAKAAAVVGAAVGAAVGGPALARVLPGIKPGDSFATQMAKNVLWSTA